MYSKNFRKSKIKSLVLISSITFTSLLQANDFCTYHPFDSGLCVNSSLYSTAQTKIINPTYSITTLYKQIELEFDPIKDMQDTPENENQETSETKADSSTSYHSIGVQALIGDDVSSYTIPYNYTFGDFSFDLGASIVVNKLTDKNGMGDTSAGVSYRTGNTRDIGHLTIGAAAIFPTGEEIDGLGTGSMGFITSLDYRKKIGESYDVLVSGSYTIFGESDKLKIDYGDTATAIIGLKSKITPSLALRTKLSYTNTLENAIAGTDKDDAMSTLDAIVGVDVELIYGIVLNLGTVVPLNDTYGDGAGLVDDRDPIYYYRFNSTF